MKATLKKHANPKKAEVLKRFFKTGPGEYGEGDQFLGITVPQSRKIACEFQNLPLKKIEQHLHSKIHEERLIALLILVQRFKNEAERETIYNFYLKNTRYINNWDLVDLTAAQIVGAFGQLTILPKLAKSDLLWERRIAIVSTFHTIKEGNATPTLKISKLLLRDTHDLIHKAVGWMLREVGKRVSKELLIDFLEEQRSHMPRTMLRYAIEHFSAEKRSYFLAH